MDSVYRGGGQWGRMGCNYVGFLQIRSHNYVLTLITEYRQYMYACQRHVVFVRGIINYFLTIR